MDSVEAEIAFFPGVDKRSPWIERVCANRTVTAERIVFGGGWKPGWGMPGIAVHPGVSADGGLSSGSGRTGCA